MTLRFPASNLAPEMQDYGRALENSLTLTDNSQTNSSEVIASMRQSMASNYGLGARLPTLPGSLSTKIVTDLQNYQAAIPSDVTLQRSWTNIGGTITVTSPPYASNVSLAVSGTMALDPVAVVNAMYFLQYNRINISGAVSANKMIPDSNYGQALFFFPNVPASSNIVVRMQIWGYYVLTTNAVSNGAVQAGSIVRMSSNMRANALV